MRAKINPLVPVHLVIDHSVMVDEFGTPKAFEKNVALEYQRNMERYQILNGARSRSTISLSCRPAPALPPGQPRIYRARHLETPEVGGPENGEAEEIAYPDTLRRHRQPHHHGHRLGVLGWGVGGIEAEAAMLGQPVT